MRSFLTITICILTSTLFFAQEDAGELLSKVKNHLATKNSVQYDYKMTIEIPEQEAIVMRGSFKKEGKKYHATMGERWVKSDGQAQWIYDPDLNEVQIYNAKENDGLPISPEMITELYESEDYDYAITGKEVINDREVVLIEFKALDPTEEYFKMRLALTSSNSKPLYFKVFARDGSRYTLEIDEIKDDVQFENSEFSFDRSQHPGVNVEDLRM